MKKIELYLLYMNRLKKVTQSIDIYFDNLQSNFVVKISDMDESNTRHFRNPRIKTAIEEACSYLVSEDEKQLS